MEHQAALLGETRFLARLRGETGKLVGGVAQKILVAPGYGDFGLGRGARPGGVAPQVPGRQPCRPLACPP